MIIQKMADAGVINPPNWLMNNVSYLTIMGSVAYGVSDDTSDVDVYGFAIPPKDIVFPHLAGEIQGFGTPQPRFEQWQQHHVPNPNGKKQIYDFTVYSIVKYFQLCMENNPNMIDSLFTPRRCVIHSTQVFEMLREKRKNFLHKGVYHKFRGYAYAQLHKIRNKTSSENPKRAESIENFGFDVKFAYHVVRLALEAEQILVEHDLDLERNRGILKAVRRGEWTLDYLVDWFSKKEKHLDDLYANSTLRQKPDEKEIKQLLVECLEHHYGDLSPVINKDKNIDAMIRQLKDVIQKYE